MCMLMLLMILSILLEVQSQERERDVSNMPEMPEEVDHPSKGVVIVVLSIMFGITFLLLAYVRFCRTNFDQLLHQNPNLQNLHELTRSRSRLSGIDRQVIETLPFFKFSSLKGTKEGLECTVCLSKFEDTETLRLLPKCKHAFHMNCIDKWLENHSTCPLCRYRVEAGDIKNLSYSLSSRFLRVPSNLTEDPNLEIFVHRELSNRWSSRFNIGSGFWEMGKSKKQDFLVDQEGGSMGSSKLKPLHLINHKIIISDVVNRRRWSDLNSSDLLSLSSEMLNETCSSRFSPSKFSSFVPSTSNEEENSSMSLNHVEKRSMSEISNVPRFVEINKQNRIREFSSSGGSEERLWKIWYPIARRTVQLFAKEERNSVELEHEHLGSNV